MGKSIITLINPCCINKDLQFPALMHCLVIEHSIKMFILNSINSSGRLDKNMGYRRMTYIQHGNNKTNSEKESFRRDWMASHLSINFHHEKVMKLEGAKLF